MCFPSSSSQSQQGLPSTFVSRRPRAQAPHSGIYTFFRDCGFCPESIDPTILLPSYALLHNTFMCNAKLYLTILFQYHQGNFAASSFFWFLINRSSNCFEIHVVNSVGLKFEIFILFVIQFWSLLCKITILPVISPALVAMIFVFLLTPMKEYRFRAIY